jgi:hypothetical protein
MSQRLSGWVFVAIAVFVTANDVCVSTAQGQMFGARQFGRTLSPQPRPGIGASVGTLRNQRFVRGNRGRASFVGTDRAETRQFVGLQQAGAQTSIRSAVAGITDSSGSSFDANRPFVRSTGERPYDPRLVIAFQHTRPDSNVIEQQIRNRLQRFQAPIDVSVADRTATLYGEVASVRDRELAQILTSFQPGISAVRNELTVADDTIEDLPAPRRQEAFP